MLILPSWHFVFQYLHSKFPEFWNVLYLNLYLNDFSWGLKNVTLSSLIHQHLVLFPIPGDSFAAVGNRLFLVVNIISYDLFESFVNILQTRLMWCGYSSRWGSVSRSWRKSAVLASHSRINVNLLTRTEKNSFSKCTVTSCPLRTLYVNQT